MPAVFVGDFNPVALDTCQRAAAQAGVEADVYTDVEEARVRLADRSVPPPLCVFLDGRGADAAPFIAWMRGEARLFPIPLVLLVESMDETTCAEAYPLGADDVVEMADVDGVRRRLLSLASFDPANRPPMTEGVAIVAHPDLGRRQILGRTLRQVGFDVAFAADHGETLAVAASRPEARLAVIWSHLPAGGAASVVNGLQRLPHADALRIIILASGASDPSGMQQLLRLEGESLAVSRDDAPPQDLIFLANELLRRTSENLRTTAPRKLYGGLCGFRLAGALKSDFGVTFNLSPGGLYIRTLVPPSAGTLIWIELRPPLSTTAVHLRAKAVWRKVYGAGGATPPGFGAQLIPEACPPTDLQLYLNSYEAMTSRLLSTHPHDS